MFHLSTNITLSFPPQTFPAHVLEKFGVGLFFFPKAFEVLLHPLFFLSSLSSTHNLYWHYILYYINNTCIFFSFYQVLKIHLSIQPPSSDPLLPHLKEIHATYVCFASCLVVFSNAHLFVQMQSRGHCKERTTLCRLHMCTLQHQKQTLVTLTQLERGRSASEQPEGHGGVLSLGKLLEASLLAD